MCRVTENLGLARKLAHQYSKYDRSMYDDLYQEACVGLVEADKSYDETKSTFSTHAMNVMNFKIMFYLESNNTPGITSRSAGKMAMKIRKLGIENESTEYIAETLGISKERVIAVLNGMNSKLSLDKTLDVGEDTCLKNVIPDEINNTLFIHSSGLDRINDLQRTIFKLSTMGYNNQEIAEITGLSNRFVGKALVAAKEILLDWSEVFGGKQIIYEEENFELFEFIENGELVDTFSLDRTKVDDVELFVKLKKYAEKKGVRVFKK